MTTSMTSSPIENGAGYPAGLSPAQLLYPDLRQELATTRRILERVPDDKLDFRPHDKSMALGQLADHLAELSGLANTVLTSSEFDFLARKQERKPITANADRLALFDKLSGELTALIESADWNALQQTWTLRMGDHVILSDQKAKLLRTLGLSHMAHHRAQLGVYLRLLGVAVPGTYGPSADER
jgi:uncharacterized damage-inducible protein DinB